MTIQIVMRGTEEVCLYDTNQRPDVSAFSTVLNFQSKKHSFSYYKTGNSLEQVIQDAVKYAPSDVTHILYLDQGVVLCSDDYEFKVEGQYDMWRDWIDWTNCRVCLVKVSKETRININDAERITRGVIDFSILEYDPPVETLMMRLLEKGIQFNSTVEKLRQFNTVREKEVKPRLYIATPCFGAQVSCHFTSSLIRTLNLLRENNIQCDIQFLPNQIVTRARNILAYQFLVSNATHLLFIDADIQWKPEDVLKLIKHKKEICVGLYANKNYIDNGNPAPFKNIQYSSTFFPEHNNMSPDGLMEIKHGATGFMLIERQVFEKVIDDAPVFEYLGHNMNDFFPCKVVDGDYLTEDYSFCQMWRKKGGKIWADLTICLNHEGWHSYHGNPLATFEVNK